MASSGEGRSWQRVQGSRREWGSGRLYHRRFTGTHCSGDELETPGILTQPPSQGPCWRAQ